VYYHSSGFSVMFEDFSKGTQHRKYRESRLPILLFSAVLVALILWSGQMMINQLSSKQKQIQQEILGREDALLRKIQVKILETGYGKSRSGIQAAYFPVLVVEVTNISQEALTKIRLASYLKKNGGGDLRWGLRYRSASIRRSQGCCPRLFAVERSQIFSPRFSVDSDGRVDRV
jgi:hypothetical protein